MALIGALGCGTSHCGWLRLSLAIVCGIQKCSIGTVECGIAACWVWLVYISVVEDCDFVSYLTHTVVSYNLLSATAYEATQDIGEDFCMQC